MRIFNRKVPTIKTPKGVAYPLGAILFPPLLFCFGPERFIRRCQTVNRKGIQQQQSRSMSWDQPLYLIERH